MQRQPHSKKSELSETSTYLVQRLVHVSGATETSAEIKTATVEYGFSHLVLLQQTNSEPAQTIHESANKEFTWLLALRMIMSPSIRVGGDHKARW